MHKHQLDGTDNFTSKFLINDCAVKLNIPMIYASIFNFEGQAATFFSQEGPCYRCLYPEPPQNHIPNCAENGVLGPLVGILGNIQALECIKFLLAQKDHSKNHFNVKELISKLFIINGKTMSTSKRKISKNYNCKVCSQPSSKIKLSNDNRNIYSPNSVSAKELALSISDFHIFDVREQEELKAGTIPNAIHLPLSIILNNEGDFSEILKYKSSYKKICIYCQHGFRGIQAITKLSTFGVENLHNLTGGYLSWCSTLLNK
ncbi:MAG: hypothetical protein HON32_01550 [Francisellaceae bacterium]|nr:hypothetical protein [Francisellaceae bacterium]